jgi:short-subunit dehydrogenase
MRPSEQTTILITGATDGLGRGVAERLAGEGAQLHLHGRDPDKLAATADAVGGGAGGRIHTHVADFSSLDEVRRLADEVNAATDELHVLISNAGIGSGKPDLGPARLRRRDAEAVVQRHEGVQPIEAGPDHERHVPR